MSLLLQTERLVIRDYTEKDVEDAFLFLSDEDTMYYMPEEVFTQEEVATFINKQREDAHYFSIVLKSENKVIGHLFFCPYFGNHSFEIGWIVNKDYQNHGYGKEAAKELLDFAFHEKGLHRVVATCQPENGPSFKLMESLGMRREGYFKKCIPHGDEWWDEYAYAILQSEWS